MLCFVTDSFIQNTVFFCKLSSGREIKSMLKELDWKYLVGFMYRVRKPSRSCYSAVRYVFRLRQVDNHIEGCTRRKTLNIHYCTMSHELANFSR